MVRQIPALRFFPDTYFDTHKILCSKLRNDTLDAVMSARTAFFAHAQIARRKTDIVEDHNQLTFRVNLIKTDCLCQTFSAQIHISLWFEQQDLHAVHHSRSTKCFVFFFCYVNIILTCNCVNDIKTDVVTRFFVFFIRIAQTCNNIHTNLLTQTTQQESTAAIIVIYNHLSSDYKRILHLRQFRILKVDILQKTGEIEQVFRCIVR